MRLVQFFKKNSFETSKGDFNSIDINKLKSYNKVRPFGAQKYFCYVPSTSLTFSFRGEVYACSYNRKVLLGKYPENSISEIWNSDNAIKLRKHLANNDLEFGCGHCKYFVDREKYTSLKPLNFDQYAKTFKKEFPLVLEFEMSNSCNLECQMCIGEVSSAIRKNRDKLPPIKNPYNDDFFRQLEPFIPHLNEAKFYGGEPFLIPEYYKIWEMIRRLNPKLKMFVITNGTIWNDKVKNAIYGGKFDVAVSIDALNKELLEKIRKNINKESLIENIYNFKKYVDKVGTSLTLSFTIQNENWLEFPKMINFANEINAHLFVSYLETPVQFAISTLDKDQLIKIKDQLLGYKFPNFTRAERHNFKCFKDFINFLIFNIENKNKNYVDYRYGESQNEKTIELFRQEMVQYLETNFPENTIDLIKKFNELENCFESDEEKQLLFKLVLFPPINVVVDALLAKTVEELYKAVLLESKKVNPKKKEN